MKIKSLLVVAVSAIFLLCSCGHEHSDEHEGHDHEKELAEGEKGEDEHHSDEIIMTKAQLESAGLSTEVAKLGNFQEVIKASGQVLSAQGDEATIVATSNGIVRYTNNALVDGSPIRQGEAICTISAKNIVDGDPVAKAKIEFETTKKEYERAQELAKDKIVSARELEQIASRYETAKASYTGIAQRSGANGVVATSSISGFIKNRIVKQGEYVSVGQPIAVVSQNRRLVLRADVSEKYFNELKGIGSANFKMSYDTDRVYRLSDLKGRLLSYGKSSSEGSFYIPVTFEFDNVGDIVPGAYAEIYLLGRTRSNVISVPVSALTEEQGVFYVYIRLDEEGFKKQEVTIGESDGNRVEILTGVKANDNVVTKGALQVKLASVKAVPAGHNHNH